MRRLKALGLILVLVMVVATFAGCGGKDDGPKNYVTKAQYEKLSKSDNWNEMTIEDLNAELGVEGAEDLNTPAERGEEFKSYSWKGKDGKGEMLVLFQDKANDGKYTPCSMSQAGLK